MQRIIISIWKIRREKKKNTHKWSKRLKTCRLGPLSSSLPSLIVIGAGSGATGAAGGVVDVLIVVDVAVTVDFVVVVVVVVEVSWWSHVCDEQWSIFGNDVSAVHKGLIPYK